MFIGYGLMAIVLGIGSTILLYRAYGYNRDPVTGNIVQNGFVFIDAHPEAADISLNGKFRGVTSQRLDIPAGDYSLDLTRDGYRSWHRDFTLEGGKSSVLSILSFSRPNLKQAMSSYMPATQG